MDQLEKDEALAVLTLSTSIAASCAELPDHISGVALIRATAIIYRAKAGGSERDSYVAIAVLCKSIADDIFEQESRN